MMAERQYYLGIDAAKAWLEVGSWPGSERRRVAPTLTVERTLEQPKPGLHSRAPRLPFAPDHGPVPRTQVALRRHAVK